MSYQANLTKTVPKILCIGKNYIKHVKEMGGTEAPKTPVIFFKPWSSISFNPQ
jgi:acylpyruvate hydrolase